MQYEILYLVGEPHTGELQDIQKKIESIITESEATLLDEKWEDRRKLAYPIKHIVRGTFVAQRFEIADEGTENPVDSIQSKIHLMKEVLRCMIVRSESLPSLKEFATRKEEERLKHSQGPKKGQDTPQKSKERKSSLSSQPFKKESEEKEAPKERKTAPEKSSDTTSSQETEETKIDSKEKEKKEERAKGREKEI